MKSSWLNKQQIVEFKIARWNRKTRRKLKLVKTPPTGIPTLKQQYAKRMRDNPTASESRLLWAMRKVRYVNGWVLNFQTVLGPYIADIFIANRKVVVEVDGASHDTRQEYDLRRDSFLWNSGFRVIRVTNDEVWRDLDGTVKRIAEFVDTYGKKFKGWKR